jgi:hypothetical protein
VGCWSRNVAEDGKDRERGVEGLITAKCTRRNRTRENFARGTGVRGVRLTQEAAPSISTFTLGAEG